MGGLDDHRLTREHTEREVFSATAAQAEMIHLAKTVKLLKIEEGSWDLDILLHQ